MGFVRGRRKLMSKEKIHTLRSRPRENMLNGVCSRCDVRPKDS